MVLLETSMGNIKGELNPQEAPISVNNFLVYVKEGYYDGLIFHRVIRGFMIQGPPVADLGVGDDSGQVGGGGLTVAMAIEATRASAAPKHRCIDTPPSTRHHRFTLSASSRRDPSTARAASRENRPGEDPTSAGSFEACHAPPSVLRKW